MMKKENYDKLMNALLEQRKEVTASKEAAEKFLRESGIWHLLVPIKKAKKKSAKRVAR